MSHAAIQVQAIDHINMSVRDIEKSITFYTEALGFEIAEDHRNDGSRPVPWVIMKTGQDRTRALLAIYEEAETVVPSQPFISHWGFVVGPLDGIRQRLAQRGVEPLYLDRFDDGVIEYPHSRSVYIADPDGHEIELVENFGGGL